MANRTTDILGQWTLGGGPLHRRLATALRGAIERGALPDGARLPAERALARMLAVSRSTVAAAYSSLARDGLLEGRRGSGTYVRHRPRLRSIPVPTVPAIPSLLLDTPPESTIDLRLAIVDWPGEPYGDQLASLAGSDVIETEGYFPVGIPSLRRAIAAHLVAAGLPTVPDQVIVTTGAQQAIALVGALLARRGSRVAVESATFPGATAAFASLGARIVTVPVDDRGARVDVLRREDETEGVRLAYLVPTFQTPTGTVMPEARRRELALLSLEAELPVIDDCTMADLWLEDRPPPPVAAFAPDAPVITIGSMSKLVWAGLRIGWLRAPEPLVAPLASLKVAADLGSSALSQALAAALLPRAEEFRELRRRQMAASAATLCGLLADLLPEWEWTMPPGGLVLWVRLPYGDSDEFSQFALRHGVQVLPASSVSPLREFPDHLRLPLLHDQASLAEGIRRLARAWEAYEPAPPRQQAPIGVVV